MAAGATGIGGLQQPVPGIGAQSTPPPAPPPPPPPPSSAAAGAPPPPPPAAPDPVAQLTKFKQMLDAGLITQADYDAAKAKGVPPGDWPMYSRDLTSARFSPLKEINTANVARLQVAWTYRPPAPPPPPDNGKGGAAKGKGKGGPGGGLSAEVTPIVVNGVMYVPGGNRIFAPEIRSAANANPSRICEVAIEKRIATTDVAVR